MVNFNKMSQVMICDYLNKKSLLDSDYIYCVLEATKELLNRNIWLKMSDDGVWITAILP